ncbi:GlcG/HbpS family heme-binding protein [Niveispirillum sp. KHB5.9]|uniref:GlcG/HbpS family heme-binding protein n=1 Tax=Niveispirillum sp. KHB5.9 TaxID=3400269 RepID=UPI003A841063
MSSLTLAAAGTIVDEALAEARRQGFAPLCVAVLDAGAHLVALKREDGASLMRPQIAIAKATGSLGMGYGSRELARRANAAPTFYNALFAISGGAMAPSPGGVLIRDAAGTVIGAVGISGDTGDADEACAVAGVKAAGLTADPGLPPA